MVHRVPCLARSTLLDATHLIAQSFGLSTPFRSRPTDRTAADPPRSIRFAVYWRFVGRGQKSRRHVQRTNGTPRASVSMFMDGRQQQLIYICTSSRVSVAAAADAAGRRRRYAIPVARRPSQMNYNRGLGCGQWYIAMGREGIGSAA